jgi:hypothetical protein
LVLDHAGSGREVVWPACGLRRDSVEIRRKEVPLLVIPEVEFATGIGGESTSVHACIKICDGLVFSLCSNFYFSFFK